MPRHFVIPNHSADRATVAYYERTSLAVLRVLVTGRPCQPLPSRADLLVVGPTEFADLFATRLDAWSLAFHVNRYAVLVRLGVSLPQLQWGHPTVKDAFDRAELSCVPALLRAETPLVCLHRFLFWVDSVKTELQRVGILATTNFELRDPLEPPLREARDLFTHEILREATVNGWRGFFTPELNSEGIQDMSCCTIN